MNAEPALPQITVVIPAYNVAPFIGEALASVQSQSLADFEAIIIDDGSTDDTAICIAPFLADPRFRCIRTDNRGLSAARNRGLSESKTQFVALLDGDDRYRPDYLVSMLTRIRSQPHVDFVTCDAESFVGDDGPRERFSDRYPQNEPITLARLMRREVAVFGLCTLRVASVLAVGGYDESLRAAEDLDLWLRLLGQGYVGGLVRKVLVDYRRRPGSLSNNAAKLMGATALAFDKAAHSLGDRPEAALAAARRDEAQAISTFEAGVDLVLSGQARYGVTAMRQSDLKQGNRKWTVALALFSLLPPLARPALTLYRRGNQFA